MVKYPDKRETAVNECRNDLSAYCMTHAHFIEAGGNIYNTGGFNLAQAVAQRVDAIRKKLGTVTESELTQILQIQNIRFSPTPQIQSFCDTIKEKLLEKLAA